MEISQKEQKMNELARVNKARATLEAIISTKSRLEGELFIHRDRETEVRERCMREFGCDVGKLPGLVKELKETGEALLSNVESQLKDKQS